MISLFTVPTPAELCSTSVVSLQGSQVHLVTSGEIPASSKVHGCKERLVFYREGSMEHCEAKKNSTKTTRLRLNRPNQTSKQDDESVISYLTQEAKLQVLDFLPFIPPIE